MTQLNETQVSVLNEILARDPEFRAVVQQRFQVEVDSALARASQLAGTVATAETLVALPAPALKPAKALKAAKRGRPRGSVNSEGSNKMESVRKVLAAHPGIQLQEIAQCLDKAGTPMENGMLSSYLYHLVSNKEVIKKGKRNSFTYSLKSRRAAK